MKASADSRERRKARRLELSLEIRYQNQGSPQRESKRAVTKNISVGGCLLQTDENLELGSDLEMQLALSGSSNDVLEMRGKVVDLRKREPGSYEYGVAFDASQREAYRLLTDFFFAEMQTLDQA